MGMGMGTGMGMGERRRWGSPGRGAGYCRYY
jgi:hypothetical protein